MMTKRTFLTLFLAAFARLANAQTDSTAFRAYLYNNEYGVYLRINFHQQDVQVPGQELYGPLPGYLGKKNYTFYWPVVSAEVEGRKARISMVNDYGSEDLTAILTQENDTLYTLRQLDGSQIKMPEKGKWQKLPKTLRFIKRTKTVR